MTLTTMAAINDALPGQLGRHSKQCDAVGGRWMSSWNLAGLPGTGANPSSGVAGDVPVDSTTGSYRFVNPASGNTYLARIDVRAHIPSGPSGILAVYDRLWHNSGINATITTAQTINSVALTRPDANGASAEAWWEVYANMGVNAPTVTLTYTDQSGNTGQTGSSGLLAASMVSSSTGPFQLASGDTGVRSIQTWQSDLSFTSGNIGLVIRRCLTQVVVSAAQIPNKGVDRFNAWQLGFPRVYDDACLEILWGMFSANTTFDSVVMHLVQG